MPTSAASGDKSRGFGEVTSPVLRDHYQVLGVSFSLETDSRVVREFFRACYRRFRQAGPTEQTFPLEAWISPLSGPARAMAGSQQIGLSGRPMPENLAFLFLLNALMDRVSNFLVIHGAAVSVGGRGIILAGPPTAGKSTLVMELARRGAAFLSDDVAPVERRTGLLHAFPRAIGIRRDSVVPLPCDPSRLAPEDALLLPHKWLVQPEALGIRPASSSEAPCPIGAVILLDPGMTDVGESEANTSQGRRRWEMALAEMDDAVIKELEEVRGVHGLAARDGTEFPVFTFETDRAKSPMVAIADLCRRRRDVILYLDEAHASQEGRPLEPILRPERASRLLMPIARDLLNRSETGSLVASCGGLAGLLPELADLLGGAESFRLRPGEPGKTADLVLTLTHDVNRRGNARLAPTGGS